MKRKWNLSYRKGLRNAMASKDAICSQKQILFTVNYGGYDNKTDIVKLDLQTKESKVLYSENCTIRSVGVLEDHEIYFSSFSGSAYCFDLKGNQIWKTEIGGRNASFEVLIDEDRIYFYDYALYCLNKTNGDIIWMNECESNGANCTFALSGRFIFHGESKGKIRCLDKMTGEQIWEYGYQLYTEHCQLMGDKLVAFDSDGTVNILNAETGKKIAKRKIFDGYLHTKPLFINNKVYLGYGDHVINTTKGEMVCFSYDEDFNFVREFGYEVDSDITSNIFVVDDKIMFATKNEKMYLIENQNEEKIFKTKGACRYIFSHEDCILVISDKGQVECYQ